MFLRQSVIRALQMSYDDDDDDDHDVLPEGHGFPSHSIFTPCPEKRCYFIFTYISRVLLVDFYNFCTHHWKQE